MLTYDVGARGELSRYDYLYRCIREDIEAGTIAAGEKLPSKRALAEHLGVSVITIEAAYDQLIAEGYVTAKERRGYFVNDVAVAIARLPERSAPTSATSVNLSATHPSRMGTYAAVNLSGGPSVPGLFPYGSWAKTIREVLTEESEGSLLEAIPAAGSPRLRAAIAEHLRGTRGMDVSPSQVIIGAGAQYLYGLIVQLLGRDRTYAIENPGYRRLQRIYEANDVALQLVDLDASGVRVAELKTSGVDVVHLMPSHQFPTGLVTPVPRRFELLAWANDTGGYIIEDDYDCEFRFAGRPIPAMQSIDNGERVIYLNTFTKSLGGAFRIAYAVLPPHLMQDFNQRLAFYTSTVSGLDQLALARFVENGNYERHVNRLRNYYRGVRDELFFRLDASRLSGAFTVVAADDGLHCVIRFSVLRDGEEIARRLMERSVLFRPLASYYLNDSQGGRLPAAAASSSEFILAYWGIEPEKIGWIVAQLEQAVLD